MGKLKGKKAIVTGGSRGIGRAIALAYAAEGADVVITYHDREDAALNIVDIIKEMGRKAIAIQADIAKAADRQKIAEEAVKFLGEINILVNNAGVYLPKDYLDVSEEDFDTTMNVNVKGAFFLSQLIAKQMISQNKGGSILNISSFRDKAAGPGMAHYQVSKAALTMFSKSLAIEMAEHKIRVNTLSPGMIITDMHRNMDRNSDAWKDRVNSIPLKRPGVPPDLSPLAVMLVSDQADYVTASRFVVDGGRSTNPMSMPLRAKL